MKVNPDRQEETQDSLRAEEQQQKTTMMAVRAVRGLEVNWDRSLVHVFRSDLKARAPHHCFLPVSAAFGNIVTDPLGPFFVCPHVLRISRGVPRVFLIRHRFCHPTTGQFFCASFTWVVLEC